MKKLSLIVFAFGFIFYACGGGEDTSTSSSSSDNETVVAKAEPDGEKLYQGICASCHGAFGEPVLAGAGDLRNPELALEQRIKTITNGSEKNPQMVSFKDTYSEREIKAIAEYTMSFVE